MGESVAVGIGGAVGVSDGKAVIVADRGVPVGVGAMVDTGLGDTAGEHALKSRTRSKKIEKFGFMIFLY